MAIDPNLITTVSVGELPTSPFNLTDNIPHEVGTDLFKGTIQELITFITPFIGAIQFQVISLHVTQAYIDANFDMSGLGINLMLGYAICNGNNGTINKDGRVGIAYGTTTNVIGQFGGEKTHVLTSNEVPAHSHFIFANNTSNTALGPSSNYVAKERDTGGSGDKFAYGVSDGGGTTPSVGKTSQSGGGAAHNNMQPYIVELHVMRL